MTRRIILVIVDWNGTSYNDLKNTVYPSIRHIFRSFGKKPPSLEIYRREITADFMNFYWDHGIPKDITGVHLNELRKRFFETRWHAGKLRKGFTKLLELCKDQKILTAMVSAEAGKILERRLHDFQIKHFFEEVIGDAKDKKRALLAVLDRCGIASEEAAYVDDTFDGITSAKELGIQTIGFTAGYNSKRRIFAAKPDFPNRKNFRNVDSMNDVWNIIQFVNNGGGA